MTKDYVNKQADAGMPYSRPSLNLPELAADITRLNLELVRAIASDDRKDKEIASLRGELNRVHGKFEWEKVELNGFLFCALMNLVGQGMEVRRSELDKLAIRSTNENKGVVGFDIRDGDDRILKLIAVDLKSYEPGDIDFSGITPDVAQQLLYLNNPLAAALFDRWESWYAIQVSNKTAETEATVAGVNAALAEDGRSERVELTEGDRFVSEPVTKSEPINLSDNDE